MICFINEFILPLGPTLNFPIQLVALIKMIKEMLAESCNLRYILRIINMEASICIVFLGSSKLVIRPMANHVNGAQNKSLGFLVIIVAILIVIFATTILRCTHVIIDNPTWLWLYQHVYIRYS